MSSIRNIDEFENFMKKENARVARRSGRAPDEECFILAQALKISEENGEVAEKVLAHYGYQRKEKGRPTKEEISHEIADGIVTLWLLGNAMNINVAKALDDKIKIIMERDY